MIPPARVLSIVVKALRRRSGAVMPAAAGAAQKDRSQKPLRAVRTVPIKRPAMTTRSQTGLRARSASVTKTHAVPTSIQSNGLSITT